MAPAEFEEDSEEELLTETGELHAKTNKAKLAQGTIIELFKTSLQCKQVGQGAYDTHGWKKAIECWSTAANSLQEVKDDGQLKTGDGSSGDGSSGDSTDTDMVTLAKVEELQDWLNMNLAQAHLKDGNFHTALGFCDAVLGKDPFNTKALYRKAYALLMASNFSEARIHLGMLLENDPNNESAKGLLHTVNKKERSSAQGAKKAAMKMFGGLDDPRTNPDPAPKKQMRPWYKRLGCCGKRKKAS